MRYSSKPDLRNNSCQNFEDLDTSSKLSFYEDPNNMTAPALPSNPQHSFKSPLFSSLLKKSPHSTSKKSLTDISVRSENAIQNVLKKFRPNILSRSAKKKLDFNDASFLSESLILNTTDQMINSTHTEVAARDR